MEAEQLAADALVLARRFAAGATLWCVAPGAPHHARHVAVEFVHPVIVGTRSLPAAAVEPDQVRVLARPGDVLLTIGDDAGLGRRCPAWGLEHLHLDGDDPVLDYHLLWELTHVVFEHPGLLVEPEVCTDEVCITCADEGRVVEVQFVLDPSTVTGLDDGRTVEVDTTVIGAVAPGDLVLVHAGLALTVLAP